MEPHYGIWRGEEEEGEGGGEEEALQCRWWRTVRAESRLSTHYAYITAGILSFLLGEE